MAGPVFFVSDAHLGSSADPATDEPRLARLIPFLRHVGDRGAEHLYILGDLFDFWFEFIHVMPRQHARILAEVRALRERGVPVTFLGGNHDWWAGKTFEEFAGMVVHPNPISVEHQGKRLFLAHGDGLASRGDSGYVFLKAVLRNPITIRLLRMVHPDAAYWFGHRFSRFSRTHLTSRSFAISEPLAERVDAELAAGCDAFLMGHIHARHDEVRPGGGNLFVLGDWMTIFSALRLEGGEFVWEDWSGVGDAAGEGRSVDVSVPAPTVAGGHGDEQG